MSLIPVGIQAQKGRVVFVGVEGVGFWLYAPKTRLFGEAKLLEKDKEELQRFEITLAYLSLKILDAHEDSIKKELLADNPDFSELEDSELRLECEKYIKGLLRNFKINHRVLSGYAGEITALYTGNKIFTYQVSLAYAALKCRYIEESDVTKSSDKEGFVKMSDVKSGKIQIGKPDLKESDLINEFISESLISELYLFASAEHGEIDYLEMSEPTEATPDTETEAEKKD
jgi:hypothetical protein